MKKIIISLIAVAMGFYAQAASVSWALTSIKDSSGASIGATSGKFTAVVTLWASDGTTVIGTSTSTTSNGFSGMSGTIPDTATGTSYFAQLVLTASDGKTLTSEKAPLTTSAAATYSINFTNGNGFSDATAKVNFANWESGGGDVPEPNSAILMLLGMAGLALRRKIA